MTESHTEVQWLIDCRCESLSRALLQPPRASVYVRARAFERERRGRRDRLGVESTAEIIITHALALNCLST